MAAANDILLIRLKSIGDIVFTLPAVHVIRENFPGAKISFLTSREHAPLLAGFREVDETLTVDRARFQSGNPAAILAETYSLLRRVRRGHFSLVVDFQGYGETAWLAWLSGAPQRWGGVYGPGRSWAYTQGVPRDVRLHHAERYLAVLEQCGLRSGKLVNEFVLPERALEEARRFFAENHLDSAKPTLFIQPFTSSANKNWPLDRYLAVAQHWREKGMQVLFGGGPAERMALEPVRQAGFIVSAGVPLLTTGGLMKLASLVLGGDTGALHLAVAMGRRVVLIVNANAAQKCHPFQHPDWALTPPAGKPINEVEAATVREACERALLEPASPASAPAAPGGLLNRS
ncbi:MAG TPA: glycosyltransferase family 9 protein [Candidatus Acidoferrum sp.]|nr:glycosyltransferase family 9 protein [Candidatus Acidoferrum sp.]